MRTREALLQQLHAIQKESLSPENPFHLSRYDISNLTTVITTMVHIVENIDQIKHYRNLYSHWGIAPIHLENHCQREFKFEIDLERTLFNALIEPFIDNYSKLKAAGLAHIQQYCSSFDGYCIDARTRRAFEYAYQIENGTAFTVIINQCKAKLPTTTTHASYCWILAAIISDQWGKAFRADEGENAYAKFDGAFDFGSVPLIDTYLRNVLSTVPSSDYLLAYKSVPTYLLGVYFKIIFDQPEIIEQHMFDDSFFHEAKREENVSKKFRSLRFSYQQFFDDFILEQYKTLFDMTRQGILKPTVIKNLFKNLSIAMLLKLWKNPEFTQLLLAVPNPHYEHLFEGILELIKPDNKALREFFHTPLYRQNTVIHFAAKTNNPALLEETIQLALPHEIEIWAPNQDGDSAVVVAVKDQQWNCIAPFLANEKIPEMQAARMEELGKALVYVAHLSEWQHVKTIIAAGARTHHFHPETHYSVVHYALLRNETGILDSQVVAKANLNQCDPANPSSITPLICAVREYKVTLDTLAYFLTNPGIEPNTKIAGESALFIAARTNQVTKLVALLSLPNIDAVSARLPGDGLTALQIAEKNNHPHVQNILKLYALINRLLDNQLLPCEDTRFLHRIKPELIEDLFDAVTQNREAKEENKNRAQFILHECIRHLLQAVPQKPLAHLSLSFIGDAYTPTTRALNQLFQFIHVSTEPDAYAWQNELRQEALKQLEIAAEAYESIDQKQVLLENARKEPLFSEHRSSFFLFKIGRTDAQIKIDGILDRTVKKLAK
ncbi:MAG: hypothetical protein P4M14_12335 [Gammaproteobacteria bacterium]|nr:hypothetical protein [Gammaproteobacteria bacterium]